jgi:hypothetical protein
VKRFPRRWVGLLIALMTVGAACSESSRPADEDDAITLRQGDAAPDFSLPISEGKTLSLSEFRGKKAVLLYFSMGPG